jgi:hypothetical protein
MTKNREIIEQIILEKLRKHEETIIVNRSVYNEKQPIYVEQIGDLALYEGKTETTEGIPLIQAQISDEHNIYVSPAHVWGLIDIENLMEGETLYPEDAKRISGKRKLKVEKEGEYVDYVHEVYEFSEHQGYLHVLTVIETPQVEHKDCWWRSDKRKALEEVADGNGKHIDESGDWDTHYIVEYI